MLKIRINQLAVRQRMLEQSLRKSRVGCLAASVIYAFYGFSSIDSIQKFDSSISLSQNTIPRLLYVSLPFLALYFFLGLKKISPGMRLAIWIMSFSMLNTISASIHVWPLAYQGHDILPLVSGVNNSAFVLPLILIAPPTKFLLQYIFSYCLIFYGPLFYFIQFSPDMISKKVVVGDSAVSILIAIVLGLVSSRASKSFVTAQITQETLSERFLQDHVAKAISAGKWEDKMVRAFIVSLDIRGYTNLLRSYEDKLDQLRPFIHDIHVLVNEAVRIKFKGTVHKTAGDGFLAFFGMFDSHDDLSKDARIHDQREQAIIDEKLNRQRFRHCTSAIEVIFTEFEELKKKYEISQELNFCASIDFGPSLITILGDQRNEMDVISLHIAKATRLEAYSKVLMDDFGSGSYLVVSEEAIKYCPPPRDFKFVEPSQGKSLRSFKETNKIYFKKYQFDSIIQDIDAASDTASENSKKPRLSA